MKTKKLIAALLVVMMIAALLPAGAFAASDYELYVNGVSLTSGKTVACGNGTAKLTDANGALELTLKNAAISKSNISGKPNDYFTGRVNGIYYNGVKPLVIVLQGTNTINVKRANGYMADGINALGAVTIKGSGTLTINGADYGLEVYPSSEKSYELNFAGGTVNINAAKCGIMGMYVTVSGGTVNVVQTDVNGLGGIALYGRGFIAVGQQTLTVNAGALNVKAKAALGIEASRLVVTGKGRVNTEGNYSGEDNAVLVRADEISVSGSGFLNASIDNKATGNAAVAISTFMLDVSSGVVCASAKGTGSVTIGVFASELVITGGKVVAIADGAADADAVVFEINSHDIMLKNPEDGSIKAEAQKENEAHTIYRIVDGNGNYAKTVVLGDTAYLFVDVEGCIPEFKSAIQWAVDENITSGTSATTFSPDTGCTRAQIVTFLWRAMGCPEVKNSKNPFTDVKDGQWYTDAVLWAVENGITNGTSATTFSPNAKVTRAQTVTFLYRAAKGEPVDAANPFKDVKAGQYYTDAVMWAVENGITNGTSPTTFSPDKTCTRGQIVTFLYRFMGE